MSLHYRPIMPICCLGLDLVEKAFEVASMEQDGVVVRMEVEVVRLEVG